VSDREQEKAAKRAQWEEINRAKAAAKQKEQDAPKNAELGTVASQRQFQAIRGTRDLLPPDTELWNRVEQIAHQVFGTFGFGEIRPPIFEPTELFARSIGAHTDVVGKEMYTFADQADSSTESSRDSTASGASASFASGSISLRPEATASVCRAYIEHNMQQLPQPVKLYYTGPMFRRERPQKGRYRQFYQIGAEVLGGSDAPAIDAELIEMLMTFFDKVELRGTQLDINSIGCRDCRPKYVEILRAELLKVKKKLGADSQRRIETNPLRVLDSKLEHEQPLIAALPHIADHLCADCTTHYEAVKRQLQLRGILYKENWRLVRGLDYYMRTTFEITAPGLGSQNAVCGGGRYDGLVELLGGPPTKGIGFAIGEDRLILSLQENGKAAPTAGRDVYIAWMGDKAYATAVRAARDLRNAGFSVEIPPTELKFGKALERASKLDARHTLILGENEITDEEWTLKTMSTGDQVKLTEPELIDFLRKQL
jgi:histidyl-tRNA synthetase